MVLFLTLLSGICWTIVYIELIHVGFKDKAYGMPLFALALNIAWEGLYSYITLKNNFASVQAWINLIWFILDIIIVYTYLKFGRKDFSKYADEKYFIPWTLTVFLMSFAIQYSFFIEFGNLGSWYSAFIQNLIMSVLYINMLITRRSTKGQNLTIAISKWIGTLAPAILYGIIYGNQLSLVLGIFCSIFDIIYILYLNAVKKTDFSKSDSSDIYNSNSMGVPKS